MIDETFLRRLAYVKSLYNLSKNQYKQFSDIGISRSVVSLDSCIESYLWIILEKKESNLIKKINEISLYDILSEIKKISPEIDITLIKELHKTRNAIQHNGFLVAKSQVNRYFSFIEQVLNSTCNLVFEIPWKHVSLSSLILEEQVKKFYLQAEKTYSERKYRDAAKFLILSFEYAKRDRQFLQGGSGILLSRIAAETANEDNGDKTILEYTKKIEQELEVLKLGLDYSKWLGYRRELGNVNPIDILYDVDKDILINEEKMYLFENEEDIHEWVIRNLDFILETILMWEDSILNIIGN